MKKSLFIVPLILFFLFNLSAQSKETDNNINISGTIKNPKVDQIKIGKHSAKLDENGYFELRFDLQEADYFVLEHEKKALLFLTPGDRISLALDAEDFNRTLHFTGRGADVNNYFMRVVLLVEKHLKPINFNEFYSLNEKNFIKRLDELTAIFQNLLDEFLKTHPNINEKFAKFEQAKILYSWARTRLLYPVLHRRFTKKKALKLNEDYNNYLFKLNFNDPTLMPVRDYTSFLSTYISIKKDEELEKNGSLRNKENWLTNVRYRVVLDTFTDQSIKNHYLFTFLKEHIENWGIKNIDTIMKTFNENCTDEKYLSEINELYEKDAAPVKGRTIKIYKTVNNITLDAYIYSPPDLQAGDKRPAIVFFHGGGWNLGKPQWHWGICPHYASKGMVAISIDYRLTDRHNVTPIEEIADAKSAIRWIRQYADELGVDPERIVASGYSAGGHLAAATAILKGFEETNEDQTVRSVPNALFLMSSAVNVDVPTEGWFARLLKGRANPKDCSPAHHIRSGLPPTIVFHAVEDEEVPFRTVKEFVEKMKQAGNHCELHFYEGKGHFFMRDDKVWEDVMTKADLFLQSLGYLDRK